MNKQKSLCFILDTNQDNYVSYNLKDHFQSVLVAVYLVKRLVRQWILGIGLMVETVKQIDEGNRFPLFLLFDKFKLANTQQ